MIAARRHSLPAIASASFAALVLSACGQHGGPPQGFPPALVSVVTVQPKSLPVEFEYPGRPRDRARSRCARASRGS